LVSVSTPALLLITSHEHEGSAFRQPEDKNAIYGNHLIKVVRELAEYEKATKEYLFSFV